MQVSVCNIARIRHRTPQERFLGGIKCCPAREPDRPEDVQALPTTTLRAAAPAPAPAAPCDQFLWWPVGLKRSPARACHFCPVAQPRTFLRLAAVTLTTGRPLSSAASSVIASALIASTEDLNRPEDEPRRAIVERRDGRILRQDVAGVPSDRFRTAPGTQSP